jgi:hypothetical protein
MFDISSVSGNIRAWTSSLLCSTLCAGVRAEIADRNCANHWPYIPLTLISPVAPAYRCLAAEPKPVENRNAGLPPEVGTPTEQQLGRSSDWHSLVRENDPRKRCAEVFVFGVFQTNIVHPDA